MTELQNDTQDKNNMPPIFDLGGIKRNEWNIDIEKLLETKITRVLF